jgi:GNAT superfamily N-acetyltransferase
MPFSAQRLEQTLTSLVDNEGGTLLVAEADGVVAGTIGAILSKPFISDADIAVEMFWWAEPQVRGGPTAMRLLERLEHWADERRAILVMSSVATIDGSPADRIYERRGYINTEKSWIRRPTWQQ